ISAISSTSVGAIRTAAGATAVGPEGDVEPPVIEIVVPPPVASLLRSTNTWSIVAGAALAPIGVMPDVDNDGFANFCSTTHWPSLPVAAASAVMWKRPA